MNAIETEYNGYRFRSRLEARWAVFFNASGIKYQYEPEGFNLGDGLYYLPDFYLPDVVKRDGSAGLWVEVKGVLSDKDKDKIERFSLGQAVLVVGQIPEEKELFGPEQDDLFWNFDTIDGDCYPATFWKNTDGPVHVYGIDNADYGGFEFFLEKYDIARKARFEHGEKGGKQ